MTDVVVFDEPHYADNLRFGDQPISDWGLIKKPSEREVWKLRAQEEEREAQQP